MKLIDIGSLILSMLALVSRQARLALMSESAHRAAPSPHVFSNAGSTSQIRRGDSPSSIDRAAKSGRPTSLISAIRFPACDAQIPCSGEQGIASKLLGKPSLLRVEGPSRGAQSVAIPCKFPWIREFVRGTGPIGQRVRASAPCRTSVAAWIALGPNAPQTICSDWP